MSYQMPFTHLLNPGHSACAGCGEILAMRHVLEAAGKDTIIANATGCSEVTTTRYPFSSFNVPWIHANFENAASVASGILAALKMSAKGGSAPRGRIRPLANASGGKGGKNVNVIAWGGDGATFDIGLGLISGTWERKENILYVCFDNEAYMNTGVQASGATPLDANTTTTPPGKNSFGNQIPKKDMLAIALAHGCSYVASAIVSNVIDIQNKVKKALTIQGPKYLQILVTCVPGWYTDSKDTIKVARLAQQTGLYPILEYVEGKLVDVVKCPKPRPAIEDYLKLQGRYKHLFKNEKGKAEIAKIQRIADDNIERFGL